MNNKSPASGGFFDEVALRIKLIFRLLGDRRVSLSVKAIPVIALVYLFFPDPVIGPLDDTAVVGIGMALFVAMCPPNVVQEHMERLRRESYASRSPQARRDENVIEGEFHDVGPAEDRSGSHQEK